MKLTALDIPESPNDIAAWLEAAICEGDLREIVTQLSAVHTTVGSASDLDTILGDDRGNVLSHGLGGLSIDQLRLLLVNPCRLFELQKVAMIDGDDYWQARFRGNKNTIDSTRSTITALTQSSSVTVASDTQKASWLRNPLVVVALAACLLGAIVGVSILVKHLGSDQGTQVANSWGWNKPLEITPETTANEYLSSLADGAKAWFNKDLANSSELQQRLKELSAGCEQLTVAAHQPLADNDRNWLRYQCRLWQRKIDGLLAKSGSPDTFQEIKRQSDETATMIEKALRQRIEALSG